MAKATRVAALVPALGVLAAAAAYTSDANARVVAILMDRSGSMVDVGRGGACGSGDRKWVCAINGVLARLALQEWATDNSDQFYYFKFSSRFPGFLFEYRDAGVTAPVGPLPYFGSLGVPDVEGTIGDLLLDEAATGGPTVDDSRTPLAGAYCQVAKFLIERQLALGDTSTPLILELGSDGLENGTPEGELCQGVFSSTPFVPGPVLPAHDIDVDDDVYTRFAGLSVPSWESNLLDVAISGGATTVSTFLGQHVPATVGVAFEPPDPGAPNQGFLSNVTFIDQFIDRTVRFGVVGDTGTGVDRVPNVELSAVGPSVTAIGDPGDPALFFSGLASARGGRVVRFGSGDDLPGTDPFGFHALPGDANDDACVDDDDAALVELFLGEAVDEADPESLGADVNLDGSIDANDFLLVRRHYGEGCAVLPGPAPQLAESLLGFESTADWSSPQARLLTTTQRTGGTFGIRVPGSQWREVSSVPFATSLLSGITSAIAFDISIPERPVNPYWFGQTLLFASCPSAGVYNAYLGAVELTGKPRGKFTTARFRIPNNVRAAMVTPHSDLTLKVVVNSGDPHVIDSLRFVP